MNPEESNEFFHNCAVAAYAMAEAEGKHEDADYVRRLAYELYEKNKDELNGGKDGSEAAEQDEGTTPPRSDT